MKENIWTHIKNYKFNNMFIKSFFVVLLLFCIPFLLLSTLYYNNLNSATYQDIEKENEATLHEMRDLTDTSLRQCESLCTYIANHSQSQMFALNNWYGNFDGDNSITEHLHSLPLIYDYIDSVYIYSDIHKTVYSNDFRVSAVSSFNDN